MDPYTPRLFVPNSLRSFCGTKTRSVPGPLNLALGAALIRLATLLPPKSRYAYKGKNMKFQKGKYIKFEETFSVTVPRNPGTPQFKWNPEAIYITHDHSEINLHYAGEQAGESAAVFTLPTDSDFLRRLSQALIELAEQYSGNQ